MKGCRRKFCKTHIKNSLRVRQQFAIALAVFGLNSVNFCQSGFKAATVVKCIAISKDNGVSFALPGFSKLATVSVTCRDGEALLG